jgi:hypothetical protein
MKAGNTGKTYGTARAADAVRERLFQLHIQGFESNVKRCHKIVHALEISA